MSIKHSKRIILGVSGLFVPFFIVTVGLAERWNQSYINSLPDSAFAAVETRADGKMVRHLPHHKSSGEVDVPHLKSALGRIHQVKWLDPINFEKAKNHLEQHYRAYKKERARAKGLKSPIDINKASVDELMQLPHMEEKLATAIVEDRETQGSFRTTSELNRVPGIGPNVFNEIEDLITVD